MTKLSKQEIYKVVNDYIGVSDDGYLSGFSYRSHEEFYPYFCGIDDIDVKSYRPASTREAFIRILETASPGDQAKILRGTLKKYAPDSSSDRGELAPEIRRWIARLEGRPVKAAQPKITTSTVDRAIRDAETLIRESDATSGVDRVHTALHGYVLAACDDAGITYSKNADLTEAVKLLRQRHPRLQPTGPRAQDITKVLYALANIVDAMNPVRNKASAAHPNEQLLEEHEAMLVINAAQTILHYLDGKLSG